MFDNINPTDNPKNDQNTNGPPSAGIQPSADINYPNRGQKVTDMFADTEPPAKPDIFKPKQTDASSQDFRSLPTEVIDEGSGSKKVFTLLIVIVGLALLAVGGYYGYDFYKNRIAVTNQDKQSAEIIPSVTETKTTPTPEANPDTDDVQTEPVTPGSVEEALAEDTLLATSSESEEKATTTVASPIDTDQDGLTDSEEEALGTNASNVDTDNDGLSDREEVNVYKTNPLSPDTDGDGYSDGDEVKNGYNPNGQGKLYDINQNQ